MSRTVEQKVVEMRFDNSNFEKNVSQSMESLNKLKSTIDKTSSGNAFSGLSKALDNINIGSVSSAIQSVTEKFNVWEQVAIGAARNVGVAIYNFVGKAIDKLAFSNLVSGWDKYAQKTEAVQTIMSSIADVDYGKTNKLDYIEKMMERLNWFTDETSYYLTDMVSNIGKFTAAGVDLDKSADAMIGIANWAAAAGANASTASRAMYQLSQALGMGSVKLMDWKSIENANMGTKEFKELAIQVAKVKKMIPKNGILKGTEVTWKNFRETLQYGWFTNDVLIDTLNQYAGYTNALNRVYDSYNGEVQTSVIIKRFEKVRAEAKRTGKSLEQLWKEMYNVDVDFNVLDKEGNIQKVNGKIVNLADSITDLGARAFAAGQEAKTFNDAIGAVTDAASTRWSGIFETIFGRYDLAKELWTGLANDLFEIFVAPLDTVTELLTQWRELGGRDLLFGRGEDEEGNTIRTGAFDIFLGTLMDISTAFHEAFFDTFDITAEKMKRFSSKILELSKRFRRFIGNVETLTDRFKGVFNYFKDIIESIDIFNKKSEDSIDILKLIKGGFENAFGDGAAVFERLKEIVGLVGDVFKGFFGELKINGDTTLDAEDSFYNLGEIAKDLGKTLEPIVDILKDVAEFAKKVGKFVSGLIQQGAHAVEMITSIIRNTNLFGRVTTALYNILDRIKTGFKSAFDSTIFENIKNEFDIVWHAIKSFIDGFTMNEGIYSKIESISAGVASAINLVGKAIRAILAVIKRLFDMGVFNEIAKFLSGTVLNVLFSIPSAIAKIVSKISDFIKTSPVAGKVFRSVATILSSIIKFVFEAANAFSNFITRTKPVSKLAGFIKSVFEAFKGSTVINAIGNKLSEAFGDVNKFFTEKFIFKNFADKLKEISSSISDFVDKSEFLSKIRDKIFNKDWDLDSFVEKFDSAVWAVYNFIKGIIDGIKPLMSAIGELFKNPKGFLFNMVNVDYEFDTLKGKIKKFFTQTLPRTITENATTGLLDSIFGGGKKKTKKKSSEIPGNLVASSANSLFGMTRESIESVNKEANDGISGIVDNLSEGLSNLELDWDGILKRLIGVVGLSLPSISFVKGIKSFSDAFTKATNPIIDGLKNLFGARVESIKTTSGALSSLFKGLQEGFASISDAKAKQIKAETFANTTESISKLLKSLGLFLLELAAAAAVLMAIDKLSGGNLKPLLIGVASFVGELVLTVFVLAKLMKALTTFSGTGVALTKECKAFSMQQDRTADNIAAISKIFIGIGAAMALLAVSAGIIAYVEKKYNYDMWKAFGIISLWSALLLGVGFVVAKFSNDVTTTTGDLTKSGLHLSRSSAADSLYAIGNYMKSIGVSMLLMSAAAAIVVKSAGGDIDKMESIFNGMQAMLAIAMGGIVIMIGIVAKAPIGKIGEVDKIAKTAGATVAKIATSILLVAKSLELLTGIKDKAGLDKSMQIVIAIGVLIGVLSVVIGKSFSKLASVDPKSFTNIGIMFLGLGATFAIMSQVFREFGKVEADGGDIAHATQGFILAFGSIALLLAEAVALSIWAKKSDVAIKDISLIALSMSAALYVVAAAFTKMGAVEDIAHATQGMILVVASLALLFAEVAFLSKKFSNVLAAAAGLILIVSAIAVLAGILTAISLVFNGNESGLITAGVALLAIVAALGAVALIAKFAGAAVVVLGAGFLLLGLGICKAADGLEKFVKTIFLIVSQVLVFGDTLGEALNKFIDAIFSAMPRISALITAFVRALVDAIFLNVDIIVALIGEMFIKLLSYGAQYLPQIMEYTTTIVNALVTAVTEILLNGVYTLIFSEHGLLAMVHEGFSGEHGLVNRIKDGILAILAAIRELVPDYLETILYVMKAMIDFFKEKRQLIHEAILETIVQIGENIVDSADTIMKAIADTINGLAEAIETNSGEIWAAIKRLVKAIIHSFTNLFSSGEDSIETVGANFSDGFLKGIWSKATDAISGVASWASNLINTIKEKIQSHSPSRVTEQLGEYFVEGFSKGVKENENGSTNVVGGFANALVDKFKSSGIGAKMKDTFSSAMDGFDLFGSLTSGFGESDFSSFGDNITGMFSDSLGGITDVLGSDEFTPTITPVLDLSEIQNGASQIPGMINPGSGYTVDTSVVSKSAYSPYEYYDGTEKTSTPEAQLEYFEMLKAKMDEVVSKFGNAKVVLDTGAVVGGIVGPMDMALGQRMAQVGRGVYSSTR